MIKKSVQQEDITLVYAPNIGAPKYINQIFRDIKGEIDSDKFPVELSLQRLKGC